MAEVSLTRAEVERLERDVASGAVANEEERRVVSFLVNKFRLEEAQMRSAAPREPDWVYNIWTWRF
jgi:hypothetical protein